MQKTHLNHQMGFSYLGPEGIQSPKTNQTRQICTISFSQREQQKYQDQAEHKTGS